jgi:hypothetical protein
MVKTKSRHTCLEYSGQVTFEAYRRLYVNAPIRNNLSVTIKDRCMNSQVITVNWAHHYCRRAAVQGQDIIHGYKPINDQLAYVKI